MERFFSIQQKSFLIHPLGEKAKSHLPQKLEAMATAYEEQLRLLTLIEKNTRAQYQEIQHVARRDGRIVAIELRIVIFRVEDIDTVKQVFTCEFFMAATWAEPNLEGKPEDKVD